MKNRCLRFAALPTLLLLASASFAGAERQWWNRQERQTFRERITIDGVHPTGFLDSYGRARLSDLSSSTILRKALDMGKWEKPHAPDTDVARKVLTFLEENRGEGDWDLLCEVLRLQVLIDAGADLNKRMYDEAHDKKTPRSPILSFGLVQLDWLNRRRSSGRLSWTVRDTDPAVKSWTLWTPETNLGRAQHTLIAFSGMRFGRPVVPILEAALSIKSLGVRDCVFSSLDATASSLHYGLIDRKSEQLKPPSLRCPPLEDLLQAAVTYSNKHTDREVPAYVAFDLNFMLGRKGDAKIYGNRYVKVAPRSSYYYNEVKALLAKLE